jgi:hypothetical protein
VTPLTHKRCGKIVGIAVLLHDEAIYVYCPTCHDIVESGELVCGDMEQVRLVEQLSSEDQEGVHASE